jgi:RNA polymerase sigma-70 factor (ECF subfamily)
MVQMDVISDLELSDKPVRLKQRTDGLISVRREKAVCNDTDLKGISKTIGAETHSAPELSDQTTWMLAVRDKRCKASFGHLFDHFGPSLKGVLCKSGLSHALAEDIVQDVMLTLWRKAHQFDPERAQVSAWIYQIARNRQIDVLRKVNRPLPEVLKAPEESIPDAAQMVALDQESRALRQALNQLKPSQREIVEHAYLGDLTHAEIQAKTGLPLGTIKSRIRLGLEKLRHELKELSGK